MSGYYRLIPEYIATHNSLSAEEKLFYSLIHSLISRFGFCWASNKYLSELSNCSASTIHRYLRKLAKHNLIVIEVQYNNERKIWTPETWGNRVNLLKAYGEEIVGSRDNLNQRFYTHVTDDMGGVSSVTPYNKELTRKEKHIEAWPKRLPPKKPQAARPSEHSSNDKDRGKGKDKQLLSASMKGAAPTPGPKAMVEETTSMLKEVHKIGSKYFKIHPNDYKYFLGFSPSVLSAAIYRTNMASLNGKRIANIPAYIFERCCEIRREQQS
jgi:hypothetical protein